MFKFNIHPLIVHFPIALLFLYSIIRIIPFKKWFPLISWKSVERVILFFGVLGAFVALYTGDTARHIFRPDRQIVGWHEFFANTSVWIFSLLLGGEILSWLNRKRIFKSLSKSIVWFLNFLEKILTNPIITFILAILGLIAITLTGMLGGVMVYGASSDPIAPFILKLLFSI